MEPPVPPRRPTGRTLPRLYPPTHTLLQAMRMLRRHIRERGNVERAFAGGIDREDDEVHDQETDNFPF